jgi:hypothetical protein
VDQPTTTAAPAEDGWLDRHTAGKLTDGVDLLQALWILFRKLWF